MTKKSSNGTATDEPISANQAHIKLMPILEGGETEDKLSELPIRPNKGISLTTTTLDWTPNELD